MCRGVQSTASRRRLSSSAFDHYRTPRTAARRFVRAAGRCAPTRSLADVVSFASQCAISSASSPIHPAGSRALLAPTTSWSGTPSSLGQVHFPPCPCSWHLESGKVARRDAGGTDDLSGAACFASGAIRPPRNQLDPRLAMHSSICRPRTALNNLRER